ncbi:MAG: Pr6Pr family membrane protein [Clostridia bacterium]|nr:Pr6Pr family membrane protein [Clostridia bacterium]
MLVVISSSLYARVGAVLSALIVVFSAIGLTVHKDFYAGIRRQDYYCYYTNLSNLLVLVYFALGAPRLHADGALRFLIPHVEFSVMMSIMLTFAVFHTMLFPAIRRQFQDMKPSREFSIMRVDNFVEHYLVPWLVFIYWLLCSPGKAALSVRDALLWTAAPLLYLAVIFFRAPLCGNIAGTDSPYPYPFLDVRRWGAPRVGLTCTLLYAVCTAAGLLVIAVLRLALARLGDGHALLLI